MSLGSLSMQRFWATDGHRKCTVFLFYLSSHYHIYISKSLCASRDDYFENLGETFVLACKMFASGCRPWLTNVACLSSLLLSNPNRTLTSVYLRRCFASIRCRASVFNYRYPNPLYQITTFELRLKLTDKIPGKNCGDGWNRVYFRFSVSW